MNNMQLAMKKIQEPLNIKINEYGLKVTYLGEFELVLKNQFCELKFSTELYENSVLVEIVENKTTKTLPLWYILEEKKKIGVELSRIKNTKNMPEDEFAQKLYYNFLMIFEWCSIELQGEFSHWLKFTSHEL